jgi:NADH:ubiquinone oxidoreductase subunit B-like Fe-S oxidoreductase
MYCNHETERSNGTGRTVIHNSHHGPKPYNGVGERFFAKVNTELSDKGFLVAAADDLISWARTGSLLGARLRPRCACRYICARLSADGRGILLQKKIRRTATIER